MYIIDFKDCLVVNHSTLTLYIHISTSVNACPDPLGDDKQADMHALGTTFFELVQCFNTHTEKVEVRST